MSISDLKLSDLPVSLAPEVRELITRPAEEVAEKLRQQHLDSMLLHQLGKCIRRRDLDTDEDYVLLKVPREVARDLHIRTRETIIAEGLRVFSNEPTTRFDLAKYTCNKNITPATLERLEVDLQDHLNRFVDEDYIHPSFKIRIFIQDGTLQIRIALTHRAVNEEQAKYTVLRYLEEIFNDASLKVNLCWMGPVGF